MDYTEEDLLALISEQEKYERLEVEFSGLANCEQAHRHHSANARHYRDMADWYRRKLEMLKGAKCQ